MAKVIMLIDDSKMSLEINRASLERAGYRVILAETGEEALAKLQAGDKADLIVLDLVLPGLDGFGVLSIIKNDVGLKSIPVIILTNRESEKDKEEALRLGAFDCIIKYKCSPAELLKIISTLLGV